MRVFWHRRDLRIPDNKGLTVASRDGPVVPSVAADLDADAVYWNDHYRPKRRNADRRVRDELAGRGIDAESRTDHVLVSPGRLDDDYPTHGAFYSDWQEVPKGTPFRPETDAFASFTDERTPPTPDADIDLPSAGYEAARERYDGFESPTTSVSRLSPYLAAGMIGIREVWADASDVYDAVHGGERKNVDKYRYELSWREHNYHLLYHNPNLAATNYVDFPNEIAWRDGDDARAEFEAWTAGETGYPFVDAGMRQLNEEGYIHNRPRQIVASFLTKHLLVDWRKGARHFTEHLVDHDHASNYGNWQWIASTGTDSVDVRIFDPVSQMDKYDSGAEYVTTYVPELADVPPGRIVEWPTLSARERTDLAPDYPDPIVDRNEGWDRAERVFETALGKR
ncbi:deoxyribodipyrimidine photo-lyase [Halobacteriales archaeon SW_7_68_16]|nr:MAG: deoxyribodipyrimidine photo-lyase [Halobacteriales archaeon SW_7_68_16]